MKAITLEVLAEKLEGNLWTKGNLKRIYLDEGYNTKKMSTKTYVYQKEDGSFAVKCLIDCPGQGANWIASQENEIIQLVTEKINDCINEFGVEIETAVIEEQEVLPEEQVQGYFMQWQEVRVAINRFGKLATRKRMFVVTYSGPKSKAPQRLIELNEVEMILAKEAESKGTAFEYGCEPNFKSNAN